MCQCRFTSCNKCTLLVGDADNVGGCAYVGAEGTWEISVSSIQFCSEPKIALKKKKFYGGGGEEEEKRERERKRKKIHSPQYVGSVLVHQQYTTVIKLRLQNRPQQTKILRPNT